jgi:hypothetical protein
MKFSFFIFLRRTNLIISCTIRQTLTFFSFSTYNVHRSISSYPSMYNQVSTVLKEFLLITLSPARHDYFTWIDDWPCEERSSIQRESISILILLENFFASFVNHFFSNFQLSDFNYQMCDIYTFTYWRYHTRLLSDLIHWHERICT